MPTRVMKESITTSKRLAAVSDFAERLYHRLTVVADDYGRFDAAAALIRGRCFARQLETVTEARIVQALRELQDAQLLLLYEAREIEVGAPPPTEPTYLQLLPPEWDQQKRAKHSKYPPPPGPRLGPLRASVDACEHPSTDADDRAHAPADPSEIRDPRVESRDPRSERRAAAVDEGRRVLFPTGDDQVADGNLVTWARQELGYDAYAVAYWCREYLEAVGCGNVRLPKSWYQGAQNSLRRQVGKRVPRPDQPAKGAAPPAPRGLGAEVLGGRRR